MRFFDSKGSGGSCVRATLALIDAPVEIIEIENLERETQKDWFLAINPRGEVPTLVLDDGSVLTESAATLLCLANMHPEADISPALSSSAHFQMIRWLNFAAVNIYEAYLRRDFPELYTTGDPEPVREATRDHLDRHWELMNEISSTGPWFMGRQFSVLDIYLWMLVQWEGDDDHMRKHFPRIANIAQKVKMRPEIKPVHEYHFGRAS